MKPGQTTVLGLLLVLLALEALRSPNVLSFLKTWLSNFRNAINASASQKTSSGGNQQPNSQPFSPPTPQPLQQPKPKPPSGPQPF